jgi:hypothetical protein
MDKQVHGLQDTFILFAAQVAVGEMPELLTPLIDIMAEPSFVSAVNKKAH